MPEWLLRSITESAFMESLRRCARLCGWLTYHALYSRGSEPGFPDLVLVKPPVLWFIETKTEKGRIRPEQQHWLDLLSQCTEIRVSLARPRDQQEIIEGLRAWQARAPEENEGEG